MSEKEYPVEVQMHLECETERGNEIVSVECSSGKNSYKLYTAITKFESIFWISTFLYKNDKYIDKDTVMITPEILKVLNGEGLSCANKGDKAI